MAREDAQCVWHMHTLAGMAVSAQEDGLLPVHMYSHNFWNRLSYHDFEGPSMRLDERARLVQSFGSDNQALILRNHGLLTVGRTIAEAFIRFWRLNRACEIQLAAQAAKLRLPVARGVRSLVPDGRRVPHRPGAARPARVRFDPAQARTTSYKN